MSRSPQASRWTTKCQSATLASRHQRCARLPVLGRRRCARMVGVELGECGERCFERAPQPAERRGLLLGELVLEQVGG